MMRINMLRNNIIWAALALIVLCVSCSKQTPAPVADSAPAPVMVVQAAERDVPVEIRVIGNVQAYSTVTVRSQVTGQLMKTHFKEGQTVKAGELLFTIDPRPSEAALNQAQADLAQAEAKLVQAQRDWERAQKLGPSEALAQSAYDGYKAAYDAAKAAILSNRAAVSNALLNLEFTTIRSPIDGRTGAVMIKEGNIIKAEDDEIVTINQVQPIYVSFFVPEGQLALIRERMKEAALGVRVEAPGLETAVTGGQLRFLDNTVDPNTGTILLRAAFRNETEILWPGQFVNAVLTLSVQTNAIVIPSQAVQAGQQGESVFVVKSDLTAESRPVVVGIRVGEETVLHQGIRAGELVVTSGQLRLAPGTKVQIQNGSAGPQLTSAR
jgi:membrane fusion protein, multidrug efflux system